MKVWIVKSTRIAGPVAKHKKNEGSTPKINKSKVKMVKQKQNKKSRSENQQQIEGPEAKNKKMKGRVLNSTNKITSGC